MARKKSGKKFRLLIYERMWQRLKLPCILLILASIALGVFADRLPFYSPPLRPLAFIPALISMAILVYAYAARRLAWVQCRPGHLRIQTPIYPLSVAYTRIKGTRPTPMAQIFDPAKLKASGRKWLQPYWGMTTLVVEISRYPVNQYWLRFWISPYLLPPNTTGFALLVEDWMTLSRQLDGFRNDWDMQRLEQRRQAQADSTF